jgi:hypothetical protein
MAKITERNVRKYIAELNKHKVLKKADVEPVDLDEIEEGDLYTLVDKLTDMVEMIAQENWQCELPSKFVSFHNQLMDWLIDYQQDDQEQIKADNKENTEENTVSISIDDLKEMTRKEVNEWLAENGVDLKFKTRQWKDEQDDCIVAIQEAVGQPEGADASESDREKLEAMDFDEVEEWCDEYGIKMEFDEDDWDEDTEACVDKILEAIGESATVEIDEDAVRDELEDIDGDYKKLREWLKGNDLKPKDIGFKKADYVESEDDIINKIIAYLKEKNQKNEGKTSKKSAKSSKKAEKTSKNKKKNVELENPFRSGSIQDQFFKTLIEKECPVADLAVILNKGEEKDSEKKWNAVVHTLARKFADKAPINICYKGATTVGEGMVSLVQD